jgi:hypothetical protein
MQGKKRQNIFWGLILILGGGYLILFEIGMTLSEGHILEDSKSLIIALITPIFFTILGIILCCLGIRLIFKKVRD